MRKILAIILALALLIIFSILSLCSCATFPPQESIRATSTTVSTEPVIETVTLTKDNFGEYFDLRTSIKNTGVEDVRSSGKLYFRVTATATYEIIPKYKGTWSDVKMELEFFVTPDINVWQEIGTGMTTSTLSTEIPQEQNGQPMGTISFKSEYKTYLLETTQDIVHELEIAQQLCPHISELHVKSASGTITIEK